MQISKQAADEVANQMRQAGYAVGRVSHEGWLAYTAPPRSRVRFGVEMARALPAGIASRLADLATTAHERGHAGTTLYFPGVTVRP